MLGHALALGVGAGVLLGQLVAALRQRAQQTVERGVALQGPQVFGVGAGDVDGHVVGVGVDALQASQVVVGGAFHGRGCVFADVQAQQQAGALRAAQGRALHMGDKRVEPLVVKPQPVDQRLALGQAKHARLGVAGLGQRRDRAHFDKAKAHGAQSVNAARVFVQPGGQTHAVGKAQARQRDRVADLGLGVELLQQRALGARHGAQRQVVGGFRVHAE